MNQWEFELPRLQMIISKNQFQYRVNHIGGREETAYYTDNLQDAVETAKLMSVGKLETLTQ
jgi:hypothetical protein